MATNHFVTVGDTVKLKATLHDWDGFLADPANLTVTVYRADTLAQVGDPVELNDTNKISVGVWEYLYHPIEVGVYFVEFRGTLNGSILARRIRVEVKNIVE